MLDAGDFSGTTFSLDLMVKDLGLALDAGDGLPVTSACLDAARAALADHAGEDYAALTAHVEGYDPKNSAQVLLP
jgi:3-hydroxyisobutyrate dehydrogenase-like beta-hydroxyacid dehydrogenase